MAWVTLGKRDEGEVRADARAVPQATQRPTTLAHRQRHARARRLDLYAYDRAGMIQPVARQALSRVYVPNSAGNSVDVIDPQTYKIGVIRLLTLTAGLNLSIAFYFPAKCTSLTTAASALPRGEANNGATVRGVVETFNLPQAESMH